jgi:hypothetical protein
MRKKFTHTETETLQCVDIAMMQTGIKEGELGKRAQRNRKTIRDMRCGAVDPLFSTVVSAMRQLGYRPTFEWVGLPGVDDDEI